MPTAPLQIARTLCEEVERLCFDDPVAHVYNPLDYAAEAHVAYLERYCRPRVSTLLLGMNPGPWGMAQTGVPFGEVNMVRDWLGISANIRKPAVEHPKRPIDGFDCTRSEVSGRRLWGWARDRFGSPESFFQQFFVWNYCPLAFLEDSGRNRTPDKLPLQERALLFEACDRALSALIDFIGPRHVLGVGKFAEVRARQVAGDDIAVGTILHPSPASPAANRGWSQQVEKQLAAHGIRLP